MKFFIFMVCLFLFALYSCNSSSGSYGYTHHNEVVEKESLKKEIVRCISIPFRADSMILENDSILGICGNSSEEEMEHFKSFFVPVICHAPYIDSLRSRFKGHIQLHDQDMEDYMMALLKVLPDTLSPWDFVRTNKVVLEIRAEAISPHEVTVYECYMLDDSIYNIEKRFLRADHKWSWKINDKKLHIVGQTDKTVEQIKWEARQKELLMHTTKS